MWCTVTWLCCITSLLSCPCKVIKFSIIFEALAIIFEARTVILEARGAIWTISKIVLIFNDKEVLRDPPPPVSKNTFFAVSGGSCFFEFSRVWIVVILRAQTLILASILSAFAEHWASRKTAESVELSSFLEV
jgi:hypothetical protein